MGMPKIRLSCSGATPALRVRVTLMLNVAHLPEGKVIAHPGGKASKGEGPYGPRGALEKEDTRPRAPLPHEPVVADALVPVLLVPEVGGPARVDLGDLPCEEVGVLARVASGLPGKAPEHEGIPMGGR